MSIPNDLRIRDQLEHVQSGLIEACHRFLLEKYLEDEGFGMWCWEILSSHSTRQAADAALKQHEQASA